MGMESLKYCFLSSNERLNCVLPTYKNREGDMHRKSSDKIELIG
jgi:hypothetical protein